MGLLTVVFLLAFTGCAHLSPVELQPDPRSSSSFSDSSRECGLDNEFLSEEEPNVRNRRNVFPGVRMWSNRTVYYYLDEAYFPQNGSPEERKRRYYALNGMKTIARRTCLNIIESKSAPNRIRMETKQDGGANCGFADLGMKGGEQILNVKCFGEGAFPFIHEFMHSLGVSHTQERPDRDNYIILHHVHEVDKRMKLFVPFDYGSIMQGCNFDTIDKRFQKTIGASFPSFYDILNINLMYNCQELCPKETSANCKNGGYPNPKNCKVCNCPLGYGGDLCDKLPAGCGTILKATREWQTLSWTVAKDPRDPEWASWGVDGLDPNHPDIDYTFCTHWIECDAKDDVKVRVINAETKSCNLEGLEIKNDVNMSNTSPRICYSNFKDMGTIISTLSPTPIVSWSFKERITKFTIEYASELSWSGGK